MTLPAVQSCASEGCQTLALVLLKLASAFPAIKTAVSDSQSAVHHYGPLCDEIRSMLNTDDLPDQGCAVLAILFERYLATHKAVDVMDVLSRVYGSHGAALDGLVLIRKLIDQDLIQVEAQTPWDPEAGNSATRADRLSSLIKASLELTPDFVDMILFDYDAPQASLEPYASNKEYLHDWLAYAEAACSDGMATLSEEERAVARPRSQSYSEHLYSRIVSRKEQTACAFPFDRMASEHGLERREQVAMMILLKRDLDRVPTSQVEFIQQLTNDPLERAQLFFELIDCSRLVTANLIETEEGSHSRIAKIRLTRMARERILGHEDAKDKDAPHRIARRSGLFEVVEPSQTLDDVVLPDDMKRKLLTAVRRYEKKVDARLREWGIDSGPVEQSNDEHSEAPLRVLLSGPSGTGKTYAAGAIARALGKSMLVTDISRLRSKWIGESEKQVQELFRAHSELVRMSDNPPILLLNECDQFFQSRIAPDHASDRMYNQMQNLFLEGLETMPGVLIATTNLAEHLDGAFNRRFHLKLEFPLPGPEARKALWAKHLLPTIPQSDDIDLDFLANSYEFTGGQIAVVVRSAAIEAAVSDAILDTHHLKIAAATEVKCTVGGQISLKDRIGFKAT